MLTVRPFEPRDAHAVVSVILPIQRQEFGIDITLEGQPDLSAIPQFYQYGCGNFWVAEVGAEVVGSVALLDIGQGRAALRKMFVASPYRGPVHGVAPALLGTLTAWARTRQLAQIYLGTTDKFLAAHRFYEKNGFRVIDKSQLPPEFPIMQVDSRFYTLALQAADPGKV